MTKATDRVHPVHLVSADWAPGDRQPSHQVNQLGFWVRQHATNERIYYLHVLLTSQQS